MVAPLTVISPVAVIFIVVSAERILGISSNVKADSKTCQVKEQSQIQLNLKKKK